MEVLSLVVGEMFENCYILVNDKQEAIIIDPGDEAERIIKFAEPYKVVGILVTHFHFDHIGALKEVEEYYHLKANEEVPGFTYEVIENPGHTMDSKSFYFPEENIMFVGDFVFFHTIGRTDVDDGNPALMKTSLMRLVNTIPEDTILYPGHGRYTTLKREKRFYESMIDELEQNNP